jgi:hypothetical protein
MPLPTWTTELIWFASAHQRRSFGCKRHMRHLDDCLGIAPQFFYYARERTQAELFVKAAQILGSKAQPGDEHWLRQSIEGRVTAKPRRE